MAGLLLLSALTCTLLDSCCLMCCYVLTLRDTFLPSDLSSSLDGVARSRIIVLSFFYILLCCITRNDTVWLA